MLPGPFTEHHIPEDAGCPLPSPASSWFTPLSFPVSFPSQMAAILRYSSALIPDLVLPLILQIFPPTGSILPQPFTPKVFPGLPLPTRRHSSEMERKGRAIGGGQGADSPVWRKVRVDVLKEKVLVWLWLVNPTSLSHSQ